MTRRLGELRKGEGGRIVTVGTTDEVARRLLEMGLIEGSWVELVHEAPFGKDPVAVRVRGTMIALRRAEANEVVILANESVAAEAVADESVTPKAVAKEAAV